MYNVTELDLRVYSGLQNIFSMVYRTFSVWFTNIFMLQCIESKLTHSEETLTGGPGVCRVQASKQRALLPLPPWAVCFPRPASAHSSNPYQEEAAVSVVVLPFTSQEIFQDRLQSGAVTCKPPGAPLQAPRSPDSKWAVQIDSSHLMNV